jgi:membrane protein
MPQAKRSKLEYRFRKYLVLPIKILRLSIVDTIRQDGVEHAGYLAFLSLLSFFPFLILLISIIGFFGASEIGAQFVHLIISATPPEMADALNPRIEEITSAPPQSFLTIAILGVIWTASSSVEGCRTILNRAYRVAFPPPYIFRRLVSIAEFFAIVFAIIVGIFVFIVIPSFFEGVNTASVFKFYVDFDFLYIRHLAIFILLTCTTSLLYFALPNAKQKISQTVPGSILTVALWLAIEKLFSIYLNNFHQFNLVYGSLAGMMISLMFFYLISLIFILGAEFNYHFHRTYQIFLKERR